MEAGIGLAEGGGVFFFSSQNILSLQAAAK